MAELNKNSRLLAAIVDKAVGKQITAEAETAIADLQKDLTTDITDEKIKVLSAIITTPIPTPARRTTNWYDYVADIRNVAYGDVPKFTLGTQGIRAVIQATDATTPRSRIANKSFTLRTVEVSARPFMNLYELQTNQQSMSDLMRMASEQMENAELAYVQQTLAASVTTWGTPYYGSGNGVVKATLDPMITYWRRQAGPGGQVTILGDLAVVSQLAGLTGFVANADATTPTYQFNDSIIREQNDYGFIGRYNGANVIALSNPYNVAGTETLIPPGYLYIIPSFASAADRPLKIVREGGLYTLRSQNIDDRVIETLMVQRFGAGVVYGNYPMMSVYEDLDL